jgi:hypothetical protein
VFLFRWHGKPTEIGLGSARDVTLARARELASQARAKLAEGINPKDARKPIEGATFGECADRVIEAMRPSWRNRKHFGQWVMILRDYAAPLRRLPVDRITPDDVLSVLKPLWNDKPETARVAQRDGAATWTNSCRSAGGSRAATTRPCATQTCRPS